MSGNVLEDAVAKFGKTSQIVVCMEEMAELTKELSKNLRGRDNVKAISEEIADVQIMLQQMQIIFRNRWQVEIMQTEKIERLKSRIEAGASLADRSCATCRYGQRGEQKYSVCFGCSQNTSMENYWTKMEEQQSEQSDADWLSRS